MNEGQSRSVLSIALSILAGIACAIAAFFLLILIFIATGLFGWSDGGDPGYLRKLEKTTHVTFVISIVVALIVGFYTILRMNRPKRSENAAPGNN